MILDEMENVLRYGALHPGLVPAADFLVSEDLASRKAGRHPIDGDRLYLMIVHEGGRGEEGALLETHRRYIDLQLTLSGGERIGWRRRESCRSPRGEYDVEKDLRFYEDKPRVWTDVPPGCFAIYFPEDAHAPLAGTGEIAKAVVKIAVDWV